MKVALFIGKEDISQAFIRVFNERFKSHFSEEWGIAFANFVVEPGVAPTGFNVTVYVKKPWVAVNVDTFKCEFTEEDIVLSLAFAIAKHFTPKKPAKWCKKFGFPAPRALFIAHVDDPLVLKRCIQAKTWE